MQDLTIRSEVQGDYRKVEELTRDAFWNLYTQGCNEHYLVHIMRKHPDFIGKLDFVAVYGEKVIGNIMYTRSCIVDDSGNKIETISFGPLSVLPHYQRQGVGSFLIGYSMVVARKEGYKAIIIEGHPHNYCKHGFRVSKDFNISDSEGKYPYGLLVLELQKGIIKKSRWKYSPSNVYNVDNDAAEEFDKQFEFRNKEYRYTQYLFEISCRAFVE